MGKKTLKMTSWAFFFDIFRKKTVKLVRYPNSLYSIVEYFPKNLDRTITFNSVNLKNKQTEPKKYIIFFNKTNKI